MSSDNLFAAVYPAYSPYLMSTASILTGTLRRSLLIKVISKPAPSREDVNTVIELTASKVVESLQAQSMTLYLVEMVKSL